MSEIPVSLDLSTPEETIAINSHHGKDGTHRTQEGLIKWLVEHNSGKVRNHLVITDIVIDKYHLSNVSKNSPKDEARNMMESYYQMIEYISDNLKLLMMHNGLQLSELLLVLRTRIKPSISLSTYSIRQFLQKICPYWWDAQVIGDILDLASEIVYATVNENQEKVKSDHSRIDRSNNSLTDGEKKLGKSYTAVIQEMRNHYDEHQDRVDRFFYEHAVVYVKLSDGDHVACICFDPRQLDPVANSAVCMRAHKALAHSSPIKYTIVLLSIDDCNEIAKFSQGTDSFARERLHAQLKGGRQNRPQASSEGSKSDLEAIGETTIAQQCNECSLLGKAITGTEDETHQNTPTDSTPLPFLNQFP